MAEAAGTLTDAPLPVGSLACAAGAVSIRRYVEYDVVRMGRTRHPLNALELIEPEGISDPPRDHVVGAGGVAADTDATHFDPVPVKCKAAAEDVHAADPPANHGIVWRTERKTTGGAWVEAGRAKPVGSRMVAIGDSSVDRIAVLQAVEAATRLHGGKQVGGRQSEAARKQAAGGCRVVPQAEIICGVGFLCRDDAAAQPLRGGLAPRERDGADGAIIGDDRPPHVEAQAAVSARRGRYGADERWTKLRKGRQSGAIRKGRTGHHGSESADRT